MTGEWRPNRCLEPPTDQFAVHESGILTTRSVWQRFQASSLYSACRSAGAFDDMSRLKNRVAGSWFVIPPKKR